METTRSAIIRAELAKIGLRWANCISWNGSEESLYQEALDRSEARVAEGGALVVSTGQHTGRSPKDKFIVRDEETESTVWWDNNQSMSRENFDQLRADMMLHARMKSLFVQDLVAAADPAHLLPTRVVTEYAWHALFIRHLLRLPDSNAKFTPELTIINLPSFKADPARHGTRSETVIALDLANRIVLIGGTEYAGEIKKAVFTVLNYILPDHDVLPMHCSANVGKQGDSAVFFGLSGTGKTTLSTDPQRALIGDDEHGWSNQGIFNFEGGCYAKVINLSPEHEPEIHATTKRWGTILENVVMNDAGQVDFADGSRTENTRAAYSLEVIANSDPTGCAATPRAIIMLTADAFGVLPPVACLTPEEAMHHFISGYTAKVAGTERGIKEPQATFSACFGAPFLPRHPAVYGAMLKHLIEQHQVPCYLVNTGWTGGAYGQGQRISIKVTRAIIEAVLSGEVKNSPTRIDENFGFHVPLEIPGVSPTVLNPRQAWADKQAYDAAAAKLVDLFAANAKKFEGTAAAAALRVPASRIAAE